MHCDLPSLFGDIHEEGSFCPSGPYIPASQRIVLPRYRGLRINLFQFVALRTGPVISDRAEIETTVHFQRYVDPDKETSIRLN